MKSYLIKALYTLGETMVTYTIKNYHPEMLESWLRCRALAYMRSSFQDEITAEKEHVSADNGISLVAVKDQQVIGIAEAIFLDHGEARLSHLVCLQTLCLQHLIRWRCILIISMSGLPKHC